jgi:(R,R)-butanediol dehydrogenase/meso-butanediol dehydrogenase/diacetyl reductase
VGQSAVVVGLGPIGLIVCSLLREAGAARVVGVDPVPARREMGRRFGVDAVLAPDADVAATLEELTGGDRAHIAFEVVGSQAAVDIALSSLRSGGELLLLGLVEELTLPAFDMVNAEIRLTTSVGYRDCHPELVRLVTDGRLDLAALVSDVVALADAPALLLDMAAGAPTAIKTLVRCGADR